MNRPKRKQGAMPEGALRKSQAVTTFGPGAMVDLVDAAVLVGGLDFWSYDREKQDPVLHEPRLRASLADAFRAAERPLSEDRCFREPPVADREATRRSGISVLEFPQWYVCQNSVCRALVRKDVLELKGKRYRHACADASTPHECVPIRFLGACPRGHVQDWPWIRFAHSRELEVSSCSAPSLKLEEGTTGDFSEIWVRCSCGAAAPLKDAGFQSRLYCGGHRPWLGLEGREECDNALRLLVRTASNSYFSQVVSALSLGDADSGSVSPLVAAIEAHKPMLRVATAQTLPAFRTVPGVKEALAPFSDEEVLRAVAALNKPASDSRAPLRTPEFRRFVGSQDEVHGELPGDEDIFFARCFEPQGGLPRGIERLVIAPRLREVRAQIGFTRLEPSSPDLQGEYDLQVASAPLGLATNWLPATEVLGEGVFIELSEAAVRAWEARPEVQSRERALKEGHRGWLLTLDDAARAHAPPFLGARFYMLHSLSHLLISAISLSCGYSASAIRERIYCGPSPRDATPMAAILLMTGSSGSEGTLGGLVDQGRRLRAHLQHAFDMGRLCSNDPVCADHSPHGDPTERYLEGAACHGCLFIAECSCERFNRYLDRALVVPTVSHPDELAFFSERP